MLGSSEMSGYRIALVPDLSKSIERYREARRRLFGEIVPADAKFTVVYKALDFESDRPSALVRMARRPRMRVGIVDFADLDLITLQLRAEPILVGPFCVNLPERPQPENLPEQQP
jgi:hypothetical protein